MLTGKQKRALRALGHHLTPIVMVGQSGVTPGVIRAVVTALNDHELIKVKVRDAPEDARETARALAEETTSELAQVLGHTLLLYKRRKKNPKIVLPPSGRGSRGAVAAQKKADNAGDDDEVGDVEDA